MQASFEGIHCTADHRAVLCFYSVLNAYKGLRVFCRYAQHACYPAPEHGSVAAKCYRRTYADNVTCSYCRRKSSCQRLKLTDIAGGIRVFCNGKLNCLWQLSLNNARSDCHKNMRTQQKNYHRPAPHKIVNHPDDLFKNFQFYHLKLYFAYIVIRPVSKRHYRLKFRLEFGDLRFLLLTQNSKFK